MSGGCTSDVTEPFALQALGDSMEPEFEDGAIIIVDQAAPCGNGSYVVLDYQGETHFRQYVEEDGKKYMRPLNTAYETVELAEPFSVRGVVIQKYFKRKRTHYDWTTKEIAVARVTS
ncbi:S24 family peptidase [Sulfuriflexus sp.]|uniref:S24 family peptidase n=1 Tax=Sulfuriflexus sp. TaxID=2015443 RepID=UPI0028CC928D|nr:S24 family peptidase [Sulfuriflexus sp.]MDT8404364.1 S24 family peptidase [Sulfuriflexus sp.]